MARNNRSDRAGRDRRNQNRTVRTGTTKKPTKKGSKKKPTGSSAKKPTGSSTRKPAASSSNNKNKKPNKSLVGGKKDNRSWADRKADYFGDTTKKPDLVFPSSDRPRGPDLVFPSSDRPRGPDLVFPSSDRPGKPDGRTRRSPSGRRRPVAPTPKPKPRIKAPSGLTLANPPITNSRPSRSPDKVRDDQNRCKSRPSDNRPKGGGGGSKRFVPWC